MFAIAWHLWNGNYETHAVGGKRANGFGFHDMLGNVHEWVSDWYGPYSADAQTDPTGPAEGTYRLFRGGSWEEQSFAQRASARGHAGSGLTYYTVGVRVARNP